MQEKILKKWGAWKLGKLEKQMARFLPKQKKETKPSVFEKFKKTWYLESALEKIIFVVGFLCILWKLFDILILGRWL